ncbi:hypothetical protein CEXT_791801 [Caerostris extrusa]|uniref:Uncharacterized protein n=1 Tax=Caerostris extrusa TaxID=172846 RepID=A0AAV4MIP5_CAEEX|nr:hypothetical protein CEXT_791801 [Caerostris extrusa]
MSQLCCDSSVQVIGEAENLNFIFNFLFEVTAMIGESQYNEPTYVVILQFEVTEEAENLSLIFNFLFVSFLFEVKVMISESQYNEPTML